jgi:hypothetical protein
VLHALENHRLKYEYFKPSQSNSIKQTSNVPDFAKLKKIP